MRTSTDLVEWFRASARPLPWRREPRDPYHVLVSELMLQQTQVDRVVPRFEAFVTRFPTLAALAVATEEAVLESWSGLGYYSRGRRLHALARDVIDAGGALPDTPEELQRLPGIGLYTATAVASLAFGRPSPAVDGNVRRVIARMLALAGDVRSSAATRTISSRVQELMRGQRPGEINEALMELGATLCRPRDPSCTSCPLAVGCEARRRGRQLEIPQPRSTRPSVNVRWLASCCVDPAGQWLLRRVDHGPILRGLWLPPIADLAESYDLVARSRALLPLRPAGRPVELPPVRHSITHRRIAVMPVLWAAKATARLDAGWRWIEPSSRVATSSLLLKLARRAQDAAVRRHRS